MKLSTRVRYGVRALVELAYEQDGGTGPILLDQVAREQGISRKYLDSIFARLKAAGIVRSSRGAGGGFMLARDPATLTLAEVYVGLEGPLVMVDCSINARHCGHVELCPATEVWAGLASTMRDYLGSITIQDLVKVLREKKAARTTMFYI